MASSENDRERRKWLRLERGGMTIRALDARRPVVNESASGEQNSAQGAQHGARTHEVEGVGAFVKPAKDGLQ